MMVAIRPEPELPYPRKPLKVQGGIVEEYVIPDDKKARVLEELCPFRPVPTLDEVMFDLHERKKFIVREFRVTREHGYNWLVSPYYPNSGGTVIDWVPPEFADEE
jgi:hypothetical protein